MKYKIIFISVVLLIGCCCFGCRKEKNNMTSEEMIDQIFDIKDIEYTIVEEHNKLSNEEYSGYYTVVLNMKQENAEAFIASLNEKYGNSHNVEEDRKLMENLYDMKLSEGDIYYSLSVRVKRNIEGAKIIPRTCVIWIVCSQKITGEYEVTMYYGE